VSDSYTRRKFILSAGSMAAAVAAATTLPGCNDSGSNTPPAQFKYGVASGDPLADRVILWTHAKIADSDDTVGLYWEVALDPAFATIVASGNANASAATGYTAKVDATGLVAGTTYFYRFKDTTGVTSVVGSTRTLPAAGASSVKLAVFSCTLYSEGFFNAYDAAAKSDAQYALHLGDYIYEYGAGASEFGNTDAVALGRVTVPANDIVSLADYRTRYALYRSDPNLQALHAKMPWITIWDDHEFANNAYVTGAENHNPATQGDWTARKNVAAQAYHEWLPIRAPDASNLLKIYRKFDFGNLLTLHMLDTRIEGRVRQYADYGDPITPGYAYADYFAGLTPVNGVLPDAARTMISPTQQAWLTSNLAASNATWQVVGNQDIMAKLWFPASVLNAQGAAAANPTPASIAAVTTAVTNFLTAKATRAAGGTAALTPAQSALLSTTTNPRLPYNLDAWDGYPANREAILQTVKSLNKRLVVLSGDSHNGWFNNVATLAGDRVGFEFAGTSVTSPGFESAGLGSFAPLIDGSSLVPQLGNAAIGAGLGLVDDVNYSETQRRGFLKLTVTSDSVVGEYVFVSTVKSTTYASSVGRTITVSTSGGVTYG
jgi:alkaline phosphatase D